MEVELMQIEGLRTPQLELTNRKIDNELLRLFINYVDVKEGSAKTYYSSVKQFIIFLQTFNISQPVREDIKFFKNYLLEMGKKPTTVQNYITAVKLFFQWAEQEGFYKDIAKHIKTPKVSQDHKKDYLTTEQVKMLFNNIDTSNVIGKRDYAMILLMITTGLRESETININLEDIRPRGNYTVVYIKGKGRTEKAEFVKVTKPVEKAIREYLVALKREGFEVRPEDPLFISTSNNNNNGRLSSRSVRYFVKKYLKKIGLDDERHTVHSFRHTAITFAGLENNSITDVRQYARHSNMNTTMIYYHEVDMEKNPCAEDVTRRVCEE